MNHITTILQKIIRVGQFPKTLVANKPLGRWNIESCNTKTNYKVDLSNEDHCGPCGQYAMTRLETTEKVGDVKLLEAKPKV
jgi:hypothetical protein